MIIVKKPDKIFIISTSSFNPIQPNQENSTEMMKRTVQLVQNRHFSNSPGLKSIFGHPLIQISDEVKQAINDKRPIVSLESTIISHGLPYPDNVKMAKEVEAIIRDSGCVPATIGFIQGIPKVGLTDDDLNILANSSKVYKVSRRDIPYILTNKLSGGTTIASTMILSNLTGIDVFATGGLGGVHKHGEFTMDISADLDELSKTPTVVVCSGPKSILDIGRTLEYLETKGVPVSTYNDQLERKDKMNVPGFYIRDSTYASPYVINDLKEAASMIYNGKTLMNLQNGYVFCIPPPMESALSESQINGIIEESQSLADSLGIRGKDITPFLLGKINELTNGQSVKCNVEFVKNNARVGSVIAKELAAIKNKSSNVQHTDVVKPVAMEVSPSVVEKPDAKKYKFKTAVIGSIAVDSICSIEDDNYKMRDSNPGTITHSLGGVGFNISLACTNSNTQREDNDTLFISVINQQDIAGRAILNSLKELGISDSGIYKDLQDEATAQYTSVHSGNNGELIVAVADMSIIDKLPHDFVLDKLNAHKDDLECILMDSNISSELMGLIMNFSQQNQIELIYEPTSAVKAKKISHISKSSNTVYPNNKINLITPTVAELQTIYESYQANDLFTGYDVNSWFSILDSLNIDSTFRNKLDHLSHSNPIIKNHLKLGTFQQCFQLLPYFPLIMLKDGENGVLIFQIIEDITTLQKNYDAYNNRFTNEVSDYQPTFTVLNAGRYNLGLLIQHYSIPSKIDNSLVKNVTGAGDSMIGYMLGQLSTGNSKNLLTDFSSDGLKRRNELLNKAQRVAGLSLMSENAVNVQGIRDFVK